MRLLRNIILLLTAIPLCAHSNENESTDKDLLSQLIVNHTQFAFSLYPTLDSPDSNLVFSPYSISSCLSMAYVGARDVTAQEMGQALKLDLSPKEIAAPSGLLNQSLLPASTSKSYELTLANALWVDVKTYILGDYRFAIENQFGGKVTNVLFSQPDATLATINDWVADKTKGYIKNLLTKSDITASTRLILTNAAYFKGTFVRPFNKESTHEAPFYSTSEKSKPVKMMQQTAFFPYVESELFQAVALPFNGNTKGKGQLGLFIVLPKSAENFSMLTSVLPDAFENALSGLKRQKVHLELPKFVLTKRYDLAAPLQHLGMKNPFTTQANFSGIDGLMNLYLNKVVHETYFALDENGVTAAAATAASMNATAVPLDQPPVDFIADHPFLFFIVDLKSTEVLFIGKFMDPSDIL